jgi:hypothetical protein
MPNLLNLGANLPVVDDWQGTNIFTDLMKQSRNGFGDYDDPTKYEFTKTIQLDASGNPMERFGIVVKAPLQIGDAGVYQLKFKGKAIAEALPTAIRVTNQRTDGAWQIADLTIPESALVTQTG